MAALSQTAANVVVADSGTNVTGTAGATITAGMPVYRDGADSNQYKACRANAAGTANCDGIALNGASDNQPITVCAGPTAINLGATLVVGESYYVSDAVAGQIIPAADVGVGDYVTFLGIATTTALMSQKIHNSATAHA